MANKIRENSNTLAKLRWGKQEKEFGKTTVVRVSVVNGIAKFVGSMNGEPVCALADGKTNKEALDNLWKKILK
jgi:hypothetical protein